MSSIVLQHAGLHYAERPFYCMVGNRRLFQYEGGESTSQMSPEKGEGETGEKEVGCANTISQQHGGIIAR